MPTTFNYGIDSLTVSKCIALAEGELKELSTQKRNKKF